MFLENLQKLDSGAHATPSSEIIKKAQAGLTTTLSESFTRDDIDDLKKVKNYTEKKGLGLQNSLKKQIKEKVASQKDTTKFMEWFDEFYAERKRRGDTEKELKETIPKLPAYIQYEEYSQKVVVRIANIIEEIAPGDSGNTNDSEENIFIDAHIMDKESLVKKSITQDVVNEYQQKYKKRWRPRRLAMYTYGRFMQNRRINSRLSESFANNEAIETHTDRQKRIAGTIGTFAKEHDTSLSDGKIHKTELSENQEINSIADKYIKSTITRTQAIQEFNDFFTNHSDYQTGMTGTDIMEQLDDIALIISLGDSLGRSKNRDYSAIKQKLQEFTANHSGAQILGTPITQLQLKDNTAIDKLCDQLNRKKISSAIGQIQQNTARVRLYKIKTNTVELTESNLKKQNKNWVDSLYGGLSTLTFGAAGTTWGNIALKGAIGAGLGLSGVGMLGIVGGIAGSSAVLQGLKTYRDYITEAQKTHEDAMQMGTNELDDRIKKLDQQIQNHSKIQKALSIRGFGKHAIRTKQRNILKAVNEKLHNSGAIVSAGTLIQDLNSIEGKVQATAIAKTLARIRIGRELDTNFIHGSQKGLTESERNQLMIELQSAAATWANSEGFGHLVPTNNNPSQRNQFWQTIISQHTYDLDHTYEEETIKLQDSFAEMKKEVNKGRRNMAFRDFGSNLATSTTVAGVAAGTGALINGINNGFGVEGPRYYSGPHNEYELGTYDESLSPDSITDKNTYRTNPLNDGDTVSFEGEASVDAISASSPLFGSLSDEISGVQSLATAVDPLTNLPIFDATTQAAVNEALTTELAKVKAAAINAGADIGNINLTQQRRVDGIEEILEDLQTSGKTGVTIDTIRFDETAFDQIDIQGSGSMGADPIDRAVAFNVRVDEIPISYNRTLATWPGFSNTYAVGSSNHNYITSRSQEGTGRKRFLLPWSTETKNKRERRKALKNHQKAMKKNKKYKEAYEKYKKIGQHEKDMQDLLQKQEEQLEQAKVSLKNIHNTQDDIVNLQAEKKRLEEEIKSTNKNIDDISKNIYDRQGELEKIISHKQSIESRDKLSNISKNKIDRYNSNPADMEDKEVIKRWEYDNSLIFGKVPSLKKQLGETKTAKGNIHAIQGLTLDERQMMNKNADSIYKSYLDVVKNVDIKSSSYGKDIAWVRWHLAKELGYAKGINTQDNQVKYPLLDPCKNITNTEKERIVNTHLGWEARNVYTKNTSASRFRDTVKILKAQDVKRMNELLTKNERTIHSYELRELGFLLANNAPP